jgi:hypothetical protein
MVECISQRIRIGDFTDDAGTAGHVDLKHKLPKGAIVLGWAAKIITGFTDDTTARMSVGISGELDIYTGLATDPLCDTGAGAIIGAHSSSDGTDGTNAVSGDEVTLRVNVVGGADFTSITHGEADIYVYYIQGVPDVLGRT